MNRFVIITGGECHTENIDRDIFASRTVIAADSGLDTARRLGVKPDILVGDMDSVESRCFPEDRELILAPAEKDDTDTMLAIDTALSRGAESIEIVGGGGGRADHWLSNIFMLEALTEKGVPSSMTDGKNRVRVVREGKYSVTSHGYFGILAIEDSVVSADGCKYPLSEHKLIRQRPYAVSNEVVGDRATVTVHSGKVIITESEKA